jgi:hypothetical protein
MLNMFVIAVYGARVGWFVHTHMLGIKSSKAIMESSYFHLIPLPQATALHSCFASESWRGMD